MVFSNKAQAVAAACYAARGQHAALWFILWAGISPDRPVDPRLARHLWSPTLRGRCRCRDGMTRTVVTAS